MMKIASILLRMIIGSSFLLLVGLSCTRDELDAEAELSDYLDLAATAEEQVLPPEAAPPPAYGNGKNYFPATDHIEGGIPVLRGKGYCGDGIVDGDHEQCDKSAVPTPRCTDLGGIAGIVTCRPDCTLDISQCITPEMDVLLGGRTEICYSACDNSSCEGGCVPQPGNSSGSECTFICRRNCISACEGTMDMDVESCTINCSCSTTSVLTASGSPFPNCDCVMDDCYVRVGIVPNIAAIVSTVLP